MIGEKLRQARQARQLSLAELAGKASVSVATLSRIETDKQALDVTLFLLLCRLLNFAPSEMLDEKSAASSTDPLVARITALDPGSRARLWRELAAQRKKRRIQVQNVRDLSLQVEEVMAQTDFLREELESIRMRVRKRRKSNGGDGNGNGE